MSSKVLSYWWKIDW